MTEVVQPEVFRQRDLLFRVRRTVMELLKDRGYVVPDSEIEMTKEQFIEKYGKIFKREDLDFSRSKHNDPSDKICVFFVDDKDGKKIGKKRVEEYKDRMKQAGASRSIMILSRAPSPMAKKEMELHKPAIHVEVFLDQELMFNITKHFLVPKHQVLSADEVKILVCRYHLKLLQLPRIQVNDPVARYFGLVPGQVLRISRSSETAGKYVSYRVAV
ncbi:DNA-directed RNA polymerases II and IV subunit 5A-like [Macadamia integrifolia]|uniref:DNA-directed RNA polymerases II and IV subunit 5A-like n=1 Tax=Macadamia integrifolia TaxID=60698 RepID=UPI001C4E6844|nr:DNA-directed RNA polymerases II and IV subunit 5A-like [Macadamia integrifolia]XP_042483567.1 DNA-directed RNA polymerases II and IV subunit 5A-like [Macadamia integrifolia]XP_042483568.1 DNA-directed RNA polymerases II and IV subunit 5A-like [Macadamia integrifolia]